MAGLPLRNGENRYLSQHILNMSFVEKAGSEDVFMLGQLAYGLTSANVPTPVLVEDDGTVVVSASVSLTGGTVTALQGSPPWVVTGVVGVSGTPDVNALQGTVPWVVTGAVGVTGTPDVNALQGTDPWTVDGSVGVTGGTVTAIQGTSPWISQANVNDGSGNAISNAISGRRSRRIPFM